MRLKRCYKKGEIVNFKWYDDWKDEYENPSNFRVIKGEVINDDIDTDFLFSLIIECKEERRLYAVQRNNIL